MILYLDTSSLVKLYVEEAASAAVEGLVGLAEVTGTSLIAYAEARAAFARRFRENAFSTKDYNRLRSRFESDWENFLSIHVTREIVRMAGDLAEKHGLRGFDAIHLASAVTLRENLASPVTFSCYDARLQNASQREKMDQPL
ncbi:Predicted nucleic acid-binding protein, contains PIN domain [Olavius sp. associated proteobacterium Delta 1]|nr:Predicted nucleic acid-binding protein, contains PIN domain [Olavius sp. associated proteobacterium Delta 1]